MKQHQKAKAKVAEEPITVVLFPGSSLLEFHWLDHRSAVIRCPGCGASMLYAADAIPPHFFHETEACPVLQQIDAALARYVRWTKADQN